VLNLCAVSLVAAQSAYAGLKPGATFCAGQPGRGCHYRVAALATLRECRFPGATSGLTARFTRPSTVGLPILELPTRTVDLARLRLLESPSRPFNSDKRFAFVPEEDLVQIPGG